MASAADAVPPKGPNGSSRGWKNRLMRRGSNKAHKRNEMPKRIDQPKEEDGGAARSLAAKRSQRTKKGGLIRKLKTLNTSFRKERTVGLDASILAESDSSPSNPQSPFSTDSFVTAEVRISLFHTMFLKIPSSRI
jgi:hypothetical protein